ncbi:hypothetical protein [Lactococcus nasutitermitis]|uniref:hypothetical protein n=1 Tax=Lactococcus nasutitermitis TaxID=1652957 RepID=UPI001BCC5925|nr:hypothetical protein [Lactococcus nasutitermitis]
MSGWISAKADTPVLRFYRPSRGVHFYIPTPSYTPGATVSVGGPGDNFEGVGWYEPSSGSTIYEIQNPNSLEIMLTTSSAELYSLERAGWNYVTSTMKSGGSIPVYRLYCSGSGHFFTTNAAEKNALVAAGWSYEKIGFYASKAGIPANKIA